MESKEEKLNVTHPYPSKEGTDYRLLAFVKGDTTSKAKDSAHDEITTWPHLVSIEFLAAILVMVVLLVWSLLANAPLEEPANPTETPNPAKAPWYFVGLQEMLVYFDPWIAGVMLPGLIIIGLILIPYVGCAKTQFSHSNGEPHSSSVRKFAISVFLSGFALWIILIIIGTYFRGPGWGWYWPWEDWSIHKPIYEKTFSFPPYLGAPLLLLYIGIGLALHITISRKLYTELGLIKYLIVMLFLLAMIAVPVKIFLRLIFHVKYVLTTPWFNI